MKAIIFFISLLQLPLLTVGNRFLPPFAFTATATTTTTIRISNSSTYTRRRKSNSCSLHSPYPFISSLLPPCSCLCRPHGKNHQMRWGRGGGRYSLLLMDSSFNKNDNKKSCGNCDQNRNNYGDSDADGGDNIQKAFTNLLSDLSSMRKSRISKLKATSSTSSDVKTWRKRSNHDDGSKLPKKHKKRHKQEKNQNIYNVLSRNRELCRLYSQNDHYYITNITSVVGPMHYRKVEAMICRHPKLMTDIFLHQSNSAAGTNNNNCNNNSNLRSVFDQLLMDLNLSPTFISSASTSYSCKKIEQLEQKLIPQSSSSSSKTAILPRMNRNNIRIIVKKLFTNELQMSSEDLFKVIMKAPQLLSYSSYNIEQSISYLQNELQLTNDDIRRMILIRPMVLAHNFHSIGGGGEEIDEDNCKEMETKVHENMDGVEVRHTRRGNKSDQIIHFLKSDLNIDHKRVIVRYPQIFELKPKGLMKKAHFLLEVMKLSRWNDLSSIVSAFPPVLWLSEANIKQKVHFLSTEFELDDEEIRIVLVTYPQIMGLSVDKNLKNKVDYFIGDIGEGGGVGLSRKKLKELVLYQPALLAYSLEGRIKPRLRRLEENYISFCYAPPYLMCLSEKKFDQWLEMQKSTWSIR